MSEDRLKVSFKKNIEEGRIDWSVIYVFITSKRKKQEKSLTFKTVLFKLFVKEQIVDEGTL